MLDLKKDISYIVTVGMPCGYYCLHIHVMDITIEQFGKSIKFKTLKTSKEILSECRYNPITIPMNWILNATEY